MVIRTGLEMLPPTCKHLEMDIQLSSSIFEVDHVKYIHRQSLNVRDQLKSLSLHIESDWSDNSGEGFDASLQWTRLTNQFASLTSLAINCNSSLLDVANARLYLTPTIGEHFFTGLALPNLYSLTITRCLWRLSTFTGIQDRFPSLQNLQVSHMALKLGTHKSKKKTPALWRKLARLIAQGYSGNCSLTFGGGPIIEFQGDLCGRSMNWSEPEDPAIIRTLKISVMNILSAISTNATTNNDLENRYIDLVKHVRPDVWVNFYDMYERCECDEEARYKEVDTLGMSLMYYKVIKPGTWEE
jgi:hypothetical protein